MTKPITIPAACLQELAHQTARRPGYLEAHLNLPTWSVSQ